MRSLPYDRAAAVRYAERWAMSRNPAYLNFDGLGGDCTNFISQCVYAGAGVMNYTPDIGWYYLSPDRRAAAWTGVRFFHRFLIANRGPGPFAREVGRSMLRPGDVIQLGSAGGVFYHSLLVLDASGPEIYIAAHTEDSLWRPLSSYRFSAARYMHVEGVHQ